MKQNNIDYIKYKLDTAMSRLETAHILINNNKFIESLSSSYYSIFNAATALLVVKNLSSRKHSGILSFIDKEFVKEGILDKMYSKIFHDSYKIRIEADYQGFFTASKEEAEKQLENTEKFLNEIKRILTEKYEIDV